MRSAGRDGAAELRRRAHGARRAGRWRRRGGEVVAEKLKKGEEVRHFGFVKTLKSPVSQERLPPPDAAPCLVRPYPSSQKGGTCIAEEVTDLETHRRRSCDPDGYRPPECPSCGHGVLHVHEYRDRALLADPDAAVVTIVIYRCASADCRATWRILPRFLARHLWRSWSTVHGSTAPQTPSASTPRVPERTVRRWSERLRSSARSLVQLLATSGSALLEGVVHAIGIDATRTDVIAAYSSTMGVAPSQVLAALAALIHRLGPGLRLV